LASSKDDKQVPAPSFEAAQDARTSVMTLDFVAEKLVHVIHRRDKTIHPSSMRCDESSRTLLSDELFCSSMETWY